MRVERIGDATLYLGDCREALATLPAADALITDPVWPNCPPGLLPGSGMPYTLFAQMWEAIATPRRAVVVLRHDGDPRFLAPVPLPHVRAVILPYVMPSYIGRLLGGDEIAYCFGDPVPSTPGRRVIPGRAPSVQPGGRRANGHPCSRAQAHFDFLAHWWSEPGETVIDPFMGSGTTGVAAIQGGRRFVGIEIDRAYFEIACERMRRALDQLPLFTPAPVAKQAILAMGEP